MIDTGAGVSLLVDEGDVVRQGQVIARIDSDYQEPQQRQAQASLAEQSAEGTLDANLNAAQARLKQAWTAQRPRSCISLSVPLYSLQDRTNNWVDFKIKETEINNFAVGDKIQMQGRNDSVKLDGIVESIRRKADFATQKATSERGDVVS